MIHLPVIPKLKEPLPRQGFFEQEQFHEARKHLSAHFQLAVLIAHTYAWRLQSEVLRVERRHLDLEAVTQRLDPGTTKNDDDCFDYLTAEQRNSFRAHSPHSPLTPLL